MKKDLKKGQCPHCGDKLVKKRVFGRRNMYICKKALHGEGCEYRISAKRRKEIVKSKKFVDPHTVNNHQPGKGKGGGMAGPLMFVKAKRTSLTSSYSKRMADDLRDSITKDFVAMSISIPVKPPTPEEIAKWNKQREMEEERATLEFATNLVREFGMVCDVSGQDISRKVGEYIKGLIKEAEDRYSYDW